MDAASAATDEPAGISAARATNPTASATTASPQPSPSHSDAAATAELDGRTHQSTFREAAAK